MLLQLVEDRACLHVVLLQVGDELLGLQTVTSLYVSIRRGERSPTRHIPAQKAVESGRSDETLHDGRYVYWAGWRG